MSDPKLCKDCRHLDGDRCRARLHDPVTGEVASTTYARTSRLRYCGPSAMLWEPLVLDAEQPIETAYCCDYDWNVGVFQACPTCERPFHDMSADIEDPPTSLGDAFDNAAAGMFAVDKFRDWPYGKGEGDNCRNVCSSCNLPYRGPERSTSCLRCAIAAQLWWDSMSVEEQKTETMRRYAQMTRMMRDLFKPDSPDSDNSQQ